MKNLFLVLWLLLAVVLSGCESKETTLVGKWQAPCPDIEEKYGCFLIAEFSRPGTFTLSVPYMLRTRFLLEGRYQQFDTSKVECQVTSIVSMGRRYSSDEEFFRKLPEINEWGEIKGFLEGDKLSLTNSANRTFDFKR